MEHDKWKVGLVEISYPKEYKKRYLHNKLSLVSEDIIFPVKQYESILIFSQIYLTFSKRLQMKTLSVYLVNTYTNMKGKVMTYLNHVVGKIQLWLRKI